MTIKKKEECENLKEKQKAIKQSTSYCINIINVSTLATDYKPILLSYLNNLKKLDSN